MKAENINQAYSIAQNIRELEKQKALVASDGGSTALGVTIQSTYQDPAFVDAIRPYVVKELDRRIEEKKSYLSELGITFP